MKPAVVLLNFGGPGSLDEVPKFLYNLFSDPWVFSYPSLFRKALAFFLTRCNTKRARESYELIGGKSPLAENTRCQAEALRKELKDSHDIFFAMRYGFPSFQEVIETLKKGGRRDVLLLPLYPHFSMTTTRSSFLEWEKQSKKHDFSFPSFRICCYPVQESYLLAHKELILQTLNTIKKKREVRILFSAHGIPLKFIRQGDPYVSHINKTYKAIRDLLKVEVGEVDSALCFQSRVGPMKWTEPYISDEIKRAAKDKKGVVIVPIAFVSENSETLVELDIEYKELAEREGVLFFHRVPALGTHPLFIKALATLVREGTCTSSSCSIEFSQCWKRL